MAPDSLKRLSVRAETEPEHKDCSCLIVCLFVFCTNTLTLANKLIKFIRWRRNGMNKEVMILIEFFFSDASIETSKQNKPKKKTFFFFSFYIFRKTFIQQEKNIPIYQKKNLNPGIFIKIKALKSIFSNSKKNTTHLYSLSFTLLTH